GLSRRSMVQEAPDPRPDGLDNSSGTLLPTAPRRPRLMRKPCLAAQFGRLLREAVTTIDRHGLSRRHLGKHKADAGRFFETILARTYRSDAAQGYQERFEKYRGKLFTFLDHDGVPWNNNNAEHAVKGFAYYREVADGLLTEAGLTSYLALL